MNPNEEKILRESIRHLIKHVKTKRSGEELELRSIIRQLIDVDSAISEGQTPDVDPTPNKSTGINVLEQLLKKIIPVLEEDYKSLTTNNDQRQSFRSHILNAVVNSLTPAQVNNDAASDDELERTISLSIFAPMQKDKQMKKRKKKILATHLVQEWKAMRLDAIWHTSHIRR